MCTTIKAEYLLARLLAGGSNVVEVRDLVRLQEAIYAQLTNRVIYCDITAGSICAAVEKNPWVFQWRDVLSDDCTVTKEDGSDRYFDEDYIDRFLGKHVPKDVQRVVHEATRQRNERSEVESL